MVSRSDSSETTLFYGNFVAVVVMAPLLPFVWSGPLSWFDLGLMVAMGALGSVSHYLLIAAHRRAPASVLSPFIYTQIVWAVMLGYLVFANVPTRWTLIGAGLWWRPALSDPPGAKGHGPGCCPGRARLTKSPRAA